MKLLQDPLVLIPLGILLIGGVLLIWAIGKLFKKKPADSGLFPGDLSPLGPTDDFLSSVSAK